MEDSLAVANFEPVNIDGNGKFSFTDALVKLRRSLIGIHNKIFPVFIMNDASNPVNVLPNFTQPNAKQLLRYTVIRVDATARNFQIATVSTTKNYYFLGAYMYNGAAVAGTNYGYDATTGTYTPPAGGAMQQDAAGAFSELTCAAVTGATESYNPPLPIKVGLGIRLDAGGAGQSAQIIVFYVEETV